MLQRRTLDKYDFGKSIDVIPDFGWLFFTQDNYVLEFFEIFRTKRKDKIINRRMDTTENYVICNFNRILKAD